MKIGSVSCLRAALHFEFEYESDDAKGTEVACFVVGDHHARTRNHTLVTCKTCRRTRVWCAAAGQLHAYAGAFWERKDGMLGKRMCGASNGHGTGTAKMWEVTCQHCVDAILDYMVAARGRLVEPPEPPPTMCGYCDYEEADGSLISQCAKCRGVDGAARQ